MGFFAARSTMALIQSVTARTIPQGRLLTELISTMVEFLWRCISGDGLFSKRCKTDVFWTHVAIATDAIIWTKPSLCFDVFLVRTDGL